LVVVFLAGGGEGTEVVTKHGAREIQEGVVGRRNVDVRERKGNVHMCALLGEMCCMLVVNVFPLCRTCVFNFLVSNWSVCIQIFCQDSKPARVIWRTCSHLYLLGGEG
jgi:hypothetical protein